MIDSSQITFANCINDVSKPIKGFTPQPKNRPSARHLPNGPRVAPLLGDAVTNHHVHGNPKRGPRDDNARPSGAIGG